MKGECHVEVEVRMGYAWITLPGALSMDNYHYIERQIESKLAGKPNRIVLDLIYLHQMFSTGISLILRLNKRIIESGGFLCLVNVSRYCREYLTSVHLDKVLTIFPTDLEFEASRDDIWKKNALKNHVKFICVTKVEKGVCYIIISGGMTVGHNLSQCSREIYQKYITQYMFDLTGLDMIDSTGACLLRDVISEITQNKAQCVAYGSNNVITKLLKILSIDKIIPLYHTERQALEALN